MVQSLLRCISLSTSALVSFAIGLSSKLVPERLRAFSDLVSLTYFSTDSTLKIYAPLKSREARCLPGYLLTTGKIV